MRICGTIGRAASKISKFREMGGTVAGPPNLQQKSQESIQFHPAIKTIRLCVRVNRLLHRDGTLKSPNMSFAFSPVVSQNAVPVDAYADVLNVPIFNESHAYPLTQNSFADFEWSSLGVALCLRRTECSCGRPLQPFPVNLEEVVFMCADKKVSFLSSLLFFYA